MRLGLGQRLCCCGGETPCQTQCPGPPTVPAEYQIEVSGIGGGVCGDCSPLNGTFVLSYDPASGGTNRCVWRSPDIAMCDYGDVHWQYMIYCGGCTGTPPSLGEFCRNVLSVWRLDITIIGIPARPYGIVYSGYGDVLIPDSGQHLDHCTGWPAEIQVVRL